MLTGYILDARGQDSHKSRLLHRSGSVLTSPSQLGKFCIESCYFSASRWLAAARPARPLDVCNTTIATDRTVRHSQQEKISSAELAITTGQPGVGHSPDWPTEADRKQKRDTGPNNKHPTVVPSYIRILTYLCSGQWSRTACT